MNHNPEGIFARRYYFLWSLVTFCDSLDQTEDSNVPLWSYPALHADHVIISVRKYSHYDFIVYNACQMWHISFYKADSEIRLTLWNFDFNTNEIWNKTLFQMLTPAHTSF